MNGHILISPKFMRNLPYHWSKVVFLTRRFWEIEMRPYFWPSGVQGLVVLNINTTREVFFSFWKIAKKIRSSQWWFSFPLWNSETCKICRCYLFFRSQHSRFFDCFLEIQCPSDTKEPAILHSYPFQYKESEANKLKPVPNFAFPCQLQM